MHRRLCILTLITALCWSATTTSHATTAPASSAAASTAPNARTTTTSAHDAPTRPTADSDEGTAYSIAVDSVTVTSFRSLADVGTQKVVIDSAVLRDDVTVDLAGLLSQNSTVFVKSYGRATTATASLRGTGASHTVVTWNGMRLNSPMLGLVDLSYIPSYFIDGAALYYGASSTGITGGGLGGAVALSTSPASVNNAPAEGRGAVLKYIQGVGSFRTFDEFLRADYRAGRWQGITRVSLTTSANDFEYRNYAVRDFVLDDNGRVVGYAYPTERNDGGGFRDLHVMQDIFLDTPSAGHFSLTAWYMDSRRGIPLLSTDRLDNSRSRALKDERTLRAVAGWDKVAASSHITARAGYLYSDVYYVSEIVRTYAGTQEVQRPVEARSHVGTLFGHAQGEWMPWHRVVVSMSGEVNQHTVDTRNESYIVDRLDDNVKGYNQARFEAAAVASVRYKPTDRLGLAVNLRQEVIGDRGLPFIPALLAQWVLVPRWGLTFKASVSRNYRYPTLNDLYFKPGGNPDLRPERGFTYDGGAEFAAGNSRLKFSGALTAFDSYIDDWILWAETGRGFSRPVNISRVHSYGAEVRGRVEWTFAGEGSLAADGIAGFTRAINLREAIDAQDNAVGKQLPYIPVWSASATLRAGWGRWSAVYKWNYFSERFTTTDNSQMLTGRLVPYIMNDISVGREFTTRAGRLSLRLSVNNIFDEEYETELSRPMAGRNFGVFIELTPRL